MPSVNAVAAFSVAPCRRPRSGRNLDGRSRSHAAPATKRVGCSWRRAPGGGQAPIGTTTSICNVWRQFRCNRPAVTRARALVAGLPTPDAWPVVDRRNGATIVAAARRPDRRGIVPVHAVRATATRFSPCLRAGFLPNAARHSLRICRMAWVRCRRCPTVAHRHQSRYPAPGHSRFRRRQPARRSEYPLLRITACHIIANAPLLLALVVAGPGSGRAGCTRSPAGQGRPRNLFTWPATSAAASATVPCRGAVVRADHRR